MARFLSCFKGSLVIAAFAATSLTAQAADPCDLGVLVPGETYTFPQYTSVSGEYTPTTTGPVKILYSGNPLQVYTSADHDEASIVDGSYSYVDGKQLMSYSELLAGQTYYLYSSFTMMESTLTITEGVAPLEVISVSPSLGEGEYFSASKNYTVTVGFNAPITVGNSLLVAGEQEFRVSNRASGPYVTCDVASVIMDLYHNGSANKGDVVTLRLVNVADNSDSSNIYGENGQVDVDFVLAAKPAELLSVTNADMTNAENPFLSYYKKGDERGIFTFEFDSPVSADNAVARLTYGSPDSEDLTIYMEELTGVADGNTVSFDFTGKLRRPIDMLPGSTADTQPSALSIAFISMYSEDGQWVYTGNSTNPSGFALSFAISTLQYTIAADFTPGRGSNLEAGKEMEIWVMNGIYMETSGVRFDYMSAGNPSSVTVLVSDITVEKDGTTDMLYTFKIPEMNADAGSVVTLTFTDLEFADGVDHSNELTAEFVGSTSGVADVETDGNNVVTVYNSTGVCVLNKADRSTLNSLPKGLYVVNGKKVMIK